MQASITRLIVVAFLFTALLASVAPTRGSQCPGINTSVSPLAGTYEQITVSTSAVALTVPLKAKIAVVTVESEPIRYRDDLTDPTNTVGVLVSPGATLILCSNSIARFRAIRQGGSDATLSVSYYGN